MVIKEIPESEILRICVRHGIRINPATLALLREKEDALLATKAEKVFCPVKGQEILPEESAGIIRHCLDKRCGRCGQAILSKEFCLSPIPELRLIESCIEIENMGQGQV